MGVYLGLSAIDLPICYIVVHSMGSEKIEYSQNKLKLAFRYGGLEEEEFKLQQELKRLERELETENDPDGNGNGNGKKVDWFKYIISQFSWTEFAIAYGIHKSFIFIRLPITAAITPAIVKILRRWGFNIGAKGFQTVSTNLTANAMKDVTASSARFGTTPSAKKKWWWFF